LAKKINYLLLLNKSQGKSVKILREKRSALLVAGLVILLVGRLILSNRLIVPGFRCQMGGLRGVVRGVGHLSHFVS